MLGASLVVTSLAREAGETPGRRTGVNRGMMIRSTYATTPHNPALAHTTNTNLKEDTQ